MVVELAKLGVCGWLVSSLDGAFGSQHGQHWRRTRAAAETAGCRLGRRRSRRKELRWMRRRARAARCGAHRQGKFALGGSVGLSVGRSVMSGRGSDLPSWFALSGLVFGVWGSGFGQSPEQEFWASRLFFSSLGRSAAVLVCLMYPGLVAFAGVRSPRRVFSNRGFGVWLGRVVVGGRRVLDCCHARGTAARRALCAVFGGWESGVL